MLKVTNFCQKWRISILDEETWNQQNIILTNSSMARLTKIEQNDCYIGCFSKKNYWMRKFGARYHHIPNYGFW